MISQTKRLSLALIWILFISCFAYAQSSTYQIGKTAYYTGQYYSTTGLPKVKRSEANKREFLKSKGLTEIPYGYEIDHIVPLHKGGTDDPSNMQLLTIGQHARKTARERASSSTNSWSSPTYQSAPKVSQQPSYPSSSTSIGGRTIYTGKRGGKYYINSNGNKTYIKPKSSSSSSLPTYTSPNVYSPSPSSSSGRTIHTGSRGGRYYINSNGNVSIRPTTYASLRDFQK